MWAKKIWAGGQKEREHILTVIASAITEATAELQGRVEIKQQEIYNFGERLDCIKELRKVAEDEAIHWKARVKELEEDLKTACRNRNEGCETLEGALADRTEEMFKIKAILNALVKEPHGCPQCHSGKLIKEGHDHWPDCPYNLAVHNMDSQSRSR